MPDQDDHTKEYIPVQCHYTGHRRDPYDLDLKQYILDNAPDSPGGGVALQAVLDEGSTLDKNNAIDVGGFELNINNAAKIDLRIGMTGNAQIHAEDNYSSLYANNNNGVEVQEGSVSLTKSGITKEAACEEAGISGTFTTITNITVVNGIITDIQGT